MAHRVWTREMYMQLDKMVKDKASPGQIAAKFGIQKKDIPYRLQVLKSRKSILVWSEEELELLHSSKDLESWLRNHIKLFGKHHDRGVLIDHWMKRDFYLAEWEKEKEIRRLANMVEIKHKQIVEPIKEKPRRDPIPDEGEILVSLNHKVSEVMMVFKEFVQIEKDRLEVERYRHAVQAEQLKVQVEQLNIQRAMYQKAMEKK